jgi:eukaryotic-like serine/threonine-protein kinase
MKKIIGIIIVVGLYQWTAGYALAVEVGEKIWEFETGSAVDSSPAIGSDGTGYIGSLEFNEYLNDLNPVVL